MSTLRNSVPFVDVGNNVMLPDIAKMVRDRLESGQALLARTDDGVVGRVLKRQLQRALESKATGVLRLSNSGGCIRRLAYDYHHFTPNGHTQDASALATFAIGDATEQLFTLVVQDVFERQPYHAVVNADESPVRMFQLRHTGDQQRTVNLEVPLREEGRALVVPGHPDGDGVVPAISTTPPVGDFDRKVPIAFTLECKSMSDYGISKFREQGGYAKDDPYMGQIQTYMEASGTEWAYVLAFGKTVSSKDWVPANAQALKDGTWSVEAGNWQKANSILGCWIRRDDDFISSVRAKFRAVVNSEHPDEFERPFQPKSRRLGFPCSWCPHWRTCWPTAYEQARGKGIYRKINLLVD